MALVVSELERSMQTKIKVYLGNVPDISVTLTDHNNYLDIHNNYKDKAKNKPLFIVRCLKKRIKIIHTILS